MPVCKIQPTGQSYGKYSSSSDLLNRRETKRNIPYSRRTTPNSTRNLEGTYEGIRSPAMIKMPVRESVVDAAYPK
jgi:hypothetical protein